MPAHTHAPVSDNWKPAVPAYSAIGSKSITQLVMAYFGVQSKGDETKGRACAAFSLSYRASRWPTVPGVTILCNSLMAKAIST